MVDLKKQSGFEKQETIQGSQQLNMQQEIRSEIVQRFATWIDDVLSKEPPIEGIGQHLLAELQYKDYSVNDENSNTADLYSIWSAITALTQEIKLQGRTFKKLNDNIDNYFQPLESTIVQETRQIVEQISINQKKITTELIGSAKNGARYEILHVLTDTRDRLKAGLKSVQQGFDKLGNRHKSSGWINKIFNKSDSVKNNLYEIVSAIDKGYKLGLERLDEEMQKLGIYEIVCDEKLFDPFFMNVVDIEETDEVPDGTVLEVYKTGYMSGNEVFCPAKVKVSRKYKKV